jgi:hypothetical protein
MIYNPFINFTCSTGEEAFIPSTKNRGHLLYKAFFGEHLTTGFNDPGSCSPKKFGMI